jgi:hypothetical protein
MDTGAAQVMLLVTSIQACVHGPIGHVPTRRIHSRYVRAVGDLPWAHYRIVLQLCVWPVAR